MMMIMVVIMVMTVFKQTGGRRAVDFMMMEKVKMILSRPF